MRLLKAQSLIELLIAMSVIIVGLTAASMIIFSNVRLQERSADEVAAANLAREGVELAKAVRDSNWIAGSPFDGGLYSGMDYTAAPRIDGGAFIDFDFAPNDSNAPEAVIKRSSNPSSQQLFVQGTGASGNATLFRRLVSLNPICGDYSIAPDGAACPALGGGKIGIRVRSVVSWTKRDGTHSAEMDDDIYDWR